MALYKYTGLKYISSCIENGIYASKLDNINDPFEGKGIRYPYNYRVVCLTSSPFQMLMWAYYGNHRGCCIEYDVSDAIFKKVEYIREFMVHEEMNTEEVIKSLYKKGNEWKHEKERRLVYYEPTADKNRWIIVNRDGNTDIYFKANVKRIIFGYAAEMDEYYPEMLRLLSDYNRNHEPIEVTKCKLQRNHYRLEADKQFNLIAELRSIQEKNNNSYDKVISYTTNNQDKMLEFSPSNNNSYAGYSRISNAAYVMLFYAAEGTGEIVASTTLSGTSFVAGNNPLNVSFEPREVAKWEAALGQLLNGGYIKCCESKKDIYKVTDKGFHLSDEFKKNNRVDINMEPHSILEMLD